MSLFPDWKPAPIELKEKHFDRMVRMRHSGVVVRLSWDVEDLFKLDQRERTFLDGLISMIEKFEHDQIPRTY